MSCKEIQEKILQFIDNELKDKELEEFLKHINECPICKEELEIYYSLLNGCKQLETNLEIPEGFHESLMEKIRTSEKSIKKHKKIIAIKRYLTAAVAICICFISLKIYTDISNNPNKDKSDYQTKLFMDRSGEDNVTDSETEDSVVPEFSLTSEEGTDVKDSKGIEKSDVALDENENTAKNEGSPQITEVTPQITGVTPEFSEGIGDSLENSNILINEKPETATDDEAKTKEAKTKEESNIEGSSEQNNYGVYIGISMILLSGILALVYFYKIRR